MKNRLPDRNLKLEQLAKHFNTITDAVLNKLIDIAYLQLPKQSNSNEIKRLEIPSNIINFKNLGNYLRTNYIDHNELVFDLYSYNLLSANIVKYKIAPSNLEDYLKYKYPLAKITIKD